MRVASRVPVTSLLGSLGLHTCALLVLLLGARKLPPSTPPTAQHRDAWSGNAVEVDAVATPEATPNLGNIANAPALTQPNAGADANSANAPTVGTLANTAAQPSATTPARQQPNLKPKPPTPTRSASSGAVSAAVHADGSHDASTAPATGAFGAEGLPPGVRSLPSAFTRAIPPATGADPIWQSLPVGAQPSFIISVQVDADGHISGAQIQADHSGRETPLQFEHLRQRVIALLGGGLFALKNNAVAGSDRFRITISLSDRTVQDENAPAELVERGFDPPRGTSPGRAYFTLASGRHFEAKVEVLSSAASQQ